MHLDGSAGLNNSASPKWECVLLSRSAAAYGSVGGEMQPGDLTLWAMQPYGR